MVRKLSIEELSDKIKCYLQWIYEDGTAIKVEYYANVEKGLIDTDKVKERIEEVLDSYSTVPDVDLVIHLLRIQFRNADETYMQVDFNCDEGPKRKLPYLKYVDQWILAQRLIYVNGKLTNLCKRDYVDELGIVNFYYKSSRGICSELEDKEIISLSESKLQELTEHIGYAMGYANYFREDSKHYNEERKLLVADKMSVLVDAYKLFYDESPDFNDLLTIVKAKALLMFCRKLGEFTLSSDTDYNLRHAYENFSEVVSHLRVMGKIDDLIVPFGLKEKDSIKLQEFGKIVRSRFDGDSDIAIENYKKFICALSLFSGDLSQNIETIEIDSIEQCEENKDVKLCLSLGK